jgi:signal transduction histidine kinase
LNEKKLLKLFSYEKPSVFTEGSFLLLYYRYMNTQEASDFFLISAHELRTQLSAMKWLLKMLLDGDLGTLNDAQLSMLRQAASGNDHMITLINETMAVIKAGDTTVPYQQTPVDFGRLIESAIHDFTSEAAQKGMHIRYTNPTAPGIVMGDATKLAIVLHNLLENAIKYGNPETDISITLATGPHDVSMSITDHGIGIPAAEHDKLFGKFFRGSNVGTHDGTGLGLYATRQIIERHGGSIVCTSEDTTTTFSLQLPRLESNSQLPSSTL